MALNSISIMGRITHDLDLKHTTSNKPVITFTVAVDRDGKDAGADFITCVAWNNIAEFVKSYFGKGQTIVVNGKLQTRSYEDRNGNKRNAVEVLADRVYFGGAKPEAKSKPDKPVDINWEEANDSDLPF